MITVQPEPTVALEPTAAPEPTVAPEPTQPPEPTATPEPTAAPEPTVAPKPTAAPEPTPIPKARLDAGTYKVGTDIQPGIYAGRAGTDILSSCSWQRLSGASGDSDEILAIEIAQGQFYVEIQDTDAYFETGCEITPLADWPAPEQPPKTIQEGMHLIGRDIAPGTYVGKAGTDILSSCSWQRLSGASGDSDEILAIEIAQGQFYVEIQDTDAYFETGCEITPLADWPAPEQPPKTIQEGMHLIGRDIAPGTYVGKAGTDILSSCSWQRLSGASGDSDEILAIGIAQGQFYVEIQDTDAYFETGCELTLTE